MDDPLLVGVLEGLGHLRDDPRGQLHAQGAVAADQLAEVGAGHELDDQVIDVAVLAVVQGADQVAMIELGQGLDLAGEIGDGLGRGLVAGQDLDGHGAAQRECSALKTCPMPPWPMESTMR